jgi:hypothetical protein
VDPGERTIRKLEDLAFAQNPTKTTDPTTNTPNQPDFKPPTPTDMPNPNNPILDWAGKALDTLSFLGSITELILGFAIADILGSIVGAISNLLSLPAGWDAADRKAKFNGFCNGFWNAMQDMADAFKNDALDSLFKVTVTPADDKVPVQPGNTAPVSWPQIPKPAPHMSVLNEDNITESERQNRAGEREGCQKAYDTIMELEARPR